MAITHNFRSALGGFNRQDVVKYIEYMQNKHRSEIEQLNTQLQAALAQAKPQNAELLAELDAAKKKIAELETAIAQVALPTGDELEAYRRAERTERAAKERAAQIYTQANAVLSDTTLKVDEAAAQITSFVDQMAAQLQAAQDSVSGTKELLQEAAAALYAIRPEE